MLNRRKLLAAGPAVALASKGQPSQSRSANRRVVVETETTGLDPQQGHRLVELAAIELEAATPTGRYLEAYINPRRPSEPWAVAMHGLPDTFLARKPRFQEVIDRFLEFVVDAPLIAHNAAFDRAFLNAELIRLGREPLPKDRWICTYELAQRAYPDRYNSLAALSRRLQIPTPDPVNSINNARLVAAVYARLTIGDPIWPDAPSAGFREATSWPSTVRLPADETGAG